MLGRVSRMSTVLFSTPVDSVWANPKELMLARDHWPILAKMLEMSVDELQNRLVPRATREFVYLKRHINPDLALQIKQLEIPGVSLQREYRRYYPGGEVASHVVGFTNVDDVGQEGMELAYDEWLRGQTGSKRVIKNRLGYVVDFVDVYYSTHHWPAFNVADSAISVGAVLLILFGLIIQPKTSESAPD